LSDGESQTGGNPIIIIGDKISPKPHLIAFMQTLRQENSSLPPDQALKYAVCADSTQVALTLRKHLDGVKMVLLGPGLEGNAVTVGRMLSKKAHIVLVVDPSINPLGNDPVALQAIQKNLESLGILVVYSNKATAEYFTPVVENYVLSGASAAADLEHMTPEERAEMVDRRLDAVNKFPSLPETQRKVSALDDLDPPKKWAEAIDPDLPTRTVILRILNSARYGFRSRVETIDQAVALASAKTIREIVTACQIRQLFSKTSANTIDQFWRHSLAVGFYAKLFSLPADPAAQTSQQKAEFERFQLDDHQIKLLQQTKLWSKFALEEKDDVFTSGLLHDVGKVTMLMCLEDSLELIKTLIDAEFEETEEGKMWARPPIDIERFLMKDIDHQVIGNRLALKWELEDEVRQIIAHHHDIVEHSSPLLKLVALANLAASSLFPYPATDEQHPLPLLFKRIDQVLDKEKKPHDDADAVMAAIDAEIHEDLVEVLNSLQISEHLWQLVDFKVLFQLCYILAPKIRSQAIAFLQQTGG
jgi:HD-like signal output (HDOD) protein